MKTLRKHLFLIPLLVLFCLSGGAYSETIIDGVKQGGGSGSGDMTQAVYDTNADSMVDADKINGGIDAAKVGGGGVSTTEFDYLGSVTSDIQTQITSKVSKTDAAFTAATELTISGGAITRTQALHTVDTEADAASDNLDTISGGADGNILFIRANHTDRTVVVTESGNIVIPQGTTISLDDNIKTLLLVYDGTLTKWIVVNVLADSLSISEITLGGIVLGDLSPDAAGEFAYDGDLKYYDTALRTVANLDKTQTFTNKTLTSPVINGATGTGGKFTGDLTGLCPSVNVLVPSGTSTDVPSETVLTHADDGSAANAYVGMTLYNITDGVSGTVTASDSTTITVAAGSMSWANTNVYQLGPGPSQAGSIFYVGTAGTIRHPATAGYTAGYYVNVAGAVIVDMASDSMIFQGVVSAAFATLDAGDCIESPATKGSFYVLHNKSATEAIGFGFANAWIDGGAS